MNLPEENNYEQPPAGTHAAVCCTFIDLGTQPNEYQGEKSMKHQVIIRWELSDELMEDGRPFTIGQFYNWSMNENAKLRQHLETWRGKPFEKADLGKNGKFNTKNLLGAACTLTVGLNEKGNARVQGVGPKMKSVEAKPLVNPKSYLALTEADFEPSVLAGLTERMQEKIKDSPEYKRLVGEKADPYHEDGDDGPYDADSYGAQVDPSEEIPF